MTIEVRSERMSDVFEKWHIDGLPIPAVLHHFSDIDRGDFHDHPWGFRSIIVHGGYVERVFQPDGSSELVERRQGDSFEIAATHIHRIEALPAGECWTLVLPGPHERTSGFWQFREDGAYFHPWNDSEWKKVEAPAAAPNPSPVSNMVGLDSPQISPIIDRPSKESRHGHDTGQLFSEAAQSVSGSGGNSASQGPSGDAERDPGVDLCGRTRANDEPGHPDVGHSLRSLKGTPASIVSVPDPVYWMANDGTRDMIEHAGKINPAHAGQAWNDRYSIPLYAAAPTPQTITKGIEAAIRCAKLALFVIRKQGVMPNGSWEKGFDLDLAIAEKALADLADKPAASLNDLDQATIDRVAAALEGADIGHSMCLTRLVDGVHTYTLMIRGEVETFVDNDDADAADQVYARIREVKHRLQAEAVIAALNPTPAPRFEGAGSVHNSVDSGDNS